MANNIANFIPEIYSKKLLRDAKEITDFKNIMCNFDWEGEIKNFGDTVRICTPNADLVQIGTGVTPNATNVSPNQVVLTIDKTKNFQFYFNDVEQAQSQFKMMEGYMNIGLQKLSDEISLELQQAVLAETGVPSLGTVGAPLECNWATITNAMNKVKATLVHNKALSSNGFYTFKGNQEQALQLEAAITVPPFFFEQLMNSSKLTHPTVAGDDILYKGVAGMIAGMRIHQDTNMEKLEGYDDAAGTFVLIAGTKMGITFAEQYSKVEKLRDPQSFGDIGRALYLYGYKIVNPKSLVKVYIKVNEE
jgi:hypothetical protein